jgi:four helix bundle protein
MEQRRSQSIVQDKSFRFAVQIVGYIRRQQKDHVNLVLTKQLLRSGTSIGANVEEALGGQSSKDFISKLAIAAKEAREAGYWLRLIRDTQPHNHPELASLLEECDGLFRMLNSIILTTRRKFITHENSEPRTQNSELGEAVDSEPRPDNPKPRTQNSELRTENSEPRTQNFTAPEVSMVTEASPYSVLVVEDNLDLVMGLQDLLHHDGYAVMVAGTVAGALELVRAHRFNAIILDLGLPDGDGIEVLKESQRLDPSLPVVIVTAHISQDRTVGSLVEGAFTYLTKPYDREELRHILRRAIGVKELAVKVTRAEHLLSESEKRFRSLVESAGDAIIVGDGHGLILSWNRSASTLFGYDDEEVIGQPLTLLMPARYRHAYEQGLADACTHFIS